MPLPVSPSTRLLTQDQVELIHTSSLGILEETGVALQEGSALSLLEDSGAQVNDKTNVVLIPESLVSEALAKAPKSVKKAGIGGHYLNLKYTLEWVRKEQFIPRPVVNRQSLEAWKTKGSGDSVANAAEVLAKLLREHNPEPLPSETERRLDHAINEMMKRRGI